MDGRTEVIRDRLNHSKPSKNRRKHLSLCLKGKIGMWVNKLLIEEISRNGTRARYLHATYLPPKNDENGKLPISVSTRTDENLKNGADTRNQDYKHMHFCRIRGARRLFL